MRQLSVLTAIAFVGLLAATAPAGGAAHGQDAATREPASVGDPWWTDFNDDGFADLAIGSPYDDVGSVAGAGVVHVLYGSANGLTGSGSQVWNQDKPNVDDVAEAGDHFGWSLASGDFDGDGFGDLAIGVPDEDVTGEGLVEDFGGVNVLFGSSTGLRANALQLFLTFENPFSSSDGFRIGAAMVAVRVFDTGSRAAGPAGGHADGADLAIGVPGYEPSDDLDRGVVWFVGGLPLDPTAADAESSFSSVTSPAGCRAGTALAAGDFDTDVRDDVVVGAPGCDVPLGGGGSAIDAGMVFVIMNASSEELTTFHQDAGFLDSQETGDRLGASVAAGDVNGDGIDDILAGVPGEDLGGKADAGLVAVAWRTVVNTWALPVQDLTRQRIGGANVAGARFGASLAMGDLGASAADVAIGAPGERVGSKAGAGAVFTRLRNHPPQRWTQDSTGILDVAEAGDAFGSSLVAGTDFDNDGSGDLVIGIPREDVGGVADAGAVAVLYTPSSGSPVGAAGDDFWTQDSPGLGEQAQPNDRFGSALR